MATSSSWPLCDQVDEGREAVRPGGGGVGVVVIQANKEVRVLLYEGYTTSAPNQREIGNPRLPGKMFPEYQVVVATSGKNDEPSRTPITVEHKTGGKSLVVTLEGHKGTAYIGMRRRLQARQSGRSRMSCATNWSKWVRSTLRRRRKRRTIRF